jgi:hypothetical protein
MLYPILQYRYHLVATLNALYPTKLPRTNSHIPSATAHKWAGIAQVARKGNRSTERKRDLRGPVTLHSCCCWGRPGCTAATVGRLHCLRRLLGCGASHQLCAWLLQGGP